MILFPAVDILKGRSVRLMHGDYNQVTDYGDPVEMAQKWTLQGAEFLHVVDLDGAKLGEGVNSDVVKEITSALKIPVQLGGGIRTLTDIEKRLNTGVSRVILGTACCSNPDMIAEAIKKFGAERIVAGIDAKDGYVAIKGWVELSTLKSVDLGRTMSDIGVKYVVFTDIGRDGALTGVNVSATVELMKATGLSCIASGGVATLDDLVALKQENLYGAILGRAIYTNQFDVSDALKVV